LSEESADGGPESNLDTLLAKFDEGFSSAEQRLDAKKKQQEADDRSKIGKIVIWAFVCLIAAIILYIIVAGLALLFMADEQQFQLAPVELMVQVLSSVMLPVVTLVLGYYFAKDK